MYLNKALVLGNITRDPELKSLPSGTKVCTFSIATNRTWKDKDGNRQESAKFHNIVVFRRQAETTAQYMSKGSTVLVEGRLQTRSWEGKDDGVKRYRTEIVADRVQFGSRGSDSNSNANAQNTQEKKQQTKDDDSEGVDTIEYPEEEINPEDIPF